MAKSRWMRSKMVPGEEEERAKLKEQQAKGDHDAARKTVGRIGNIMRGRNSK